jgi:hypothetical protein
VSEPVTRNELKIMADDADREHAQLRAAIQTLDVSGSRGVVGLQVQMQDTTKEIAKLQASVDSLRRDMDKRFDDHEQDHRTDEMDRRSTRRFWVTTGIAAFVAIEAPIGYLIAHLH